MKRKVLALIMLFLFVGLVGCAKTQISDVFRFEVRELEMTLYADEAKNVEKELGLIKGAIDEDAAIVYSMSYVDGKNAGQVCYINDILEIISVEDYIDDGGIVAGTIISDSNTKVKVKAKNRIGKDIEVEGEGLLARALCHEVDHLSGIMFLDKAEELVTSDQLEDKK